jgi:glycosyltransferase involved in cell wall biosynthesis
MHRAALRDPVGFLRFLSSFRRAARHALNEVQPEIVHAHWWFPSGWVMARETAKGKVSARTLSIHGTDVRLLARNPIVLPFARSVFARAERVLPVSAFLESTLVRLRVGGGASTILPMPADSEVFRVEENVQRETGFVVAARLVRQKRVDLAIRGFAYARNRGVNAHLNIAGDGPERGRLENLVAELECSNNVTFWGGLRPPALAGLFQRSCAVVLASEQEGYGLVLVEAALCGTPAIGVRSGAIPEVVAGGETGWIVEPGDWRGIGDAMIDAASDLSKVERMGNEGRKRALMQTAQPLADRLVQVYRDLLDRKERIGSFPDRISRGAPGERKG